MCGVAPEVIREIARLFATADRAMIFWGMGISQHTHGTDNARCLIALSLICGQIGRVGTGLHPLRGQNNVQGASDAGLIPMMLPDYQRVDDAEARSWFESFWGATLDDAPGLTVTEVIDHALAGKVRGMYIMGENPAMSDPDLNHARDGLAKLDLLVVQDIFPTETAFFADVILPASAFPEKTGTFTNTDRMVQLGNRAIDPPGQARADLWIIQQLAARLGLQWDYPGDECGVANVYEEMRRTMKSISGIGWDRLVDTGSVTYPCMSEQEDGAPVVFTESFPTADGRGKLVPTSFTPAAEVPDTAYPFVLITGRELEHWHTGAMTRRSRMLDALEPVAKVSLHPSTAGNLGLSAGDVVAVESRRGRIVLPIRIDAGIPAQAAFIPFCYYEAAANLLTNPKIDPFGKIPEFKYCAVKLSPAPPQARADLLSFGGGAGA